MSGDTAYPMDRIEISGVTATGYHGVFEHEKRDGQPFVVDVVLTVDLRRAGRSDALVDTINYGEVAADVVRRIEGEPFDLIERLAEVIAGDALARPLVQAVEVAVHKPQAPVGVPFGDVVVRMTRRRPVPVVIALGANLGDPLRTLAAAVGDLRGIPGLTVTAISPLVESDPVGGPDQPAYLNAVALGTWDGPPTALLRALHRIESDHRRTREIRWGARTLDLDLIQFGAPGGTDEVLSSDSSTTAPLLPHPRAHERAFVLAPWAAVDPSATLRLGHRFADEIAAVGDLLSTLPAASRAGVRPGPAWPVEAGGSTW